MNTELLAFTARENFDFFKFDSSRISGVLSDEAKDELKASCNRILEHAHKAVKDMCCWGYELAKLRDSGRWKFVVNPENGMRFLYSSFEKFCEYAFGFSGTHTSNLLGISQFLYEKDGKLEFYNERYNDFNMSQLVELSSVERYRWPLFTSKMSVKSMRLAKKFLAVKGSSVGVTSENLLSLAQDWETALNDLNTPSKGDVQEELDLPDENEVEDGVDNEQDENGAVVELTDEQREEYVKRSLLLTRYDVRFRIWYEIGTFKEVVSFCPPDRFVAFVKDLLKKECFAISFLPFGEPYSVSCSEKGYVLSGKGDIVFDVFLSWKDVCTRIINLINTDEYFTLEEQAGFMKDLDEIEEVDEPEECLDEEKEEYEEKSEMEEETVRNAYDFSTRAGVRAFLNDYTHWRKYSHSYHSIFFSAVYGYTFKNKKYVMACERKVLDDNSFEAGCSVTQVVYYLSLGFPDGLVEISKAQFEQYCSLHKDEL